MPRKIDPSLIDYFCEVVPQGVTIISLARRFDICPDTISKHLKQRGIKIPLTGKKPLKYCIPEDELKMLFDSGMTENEIARHYGCSCCVIRDRTISLGIQPRSMSEAVKLRYQNMSSEQRQKQTEAARKVGPNITHDILVKKALRKEKSPNAFHFGPGESEIKQRLDEIGLSYTAQKAVDIYNVDFAVGSLAVEVTCVGSRYNGGNIKMNIRLKTLMERGFYPICIEFDDEATVTHGLDFAISSILDACNNPPAKG